MRRLTSLGKPLAYSGASQVLTSLSNFGFSLYLVRALEKTQFGLYGVGLAVVLLIAAMQASLFSVQFVVNVADQPEGMRASYAVHHAAVLMIVGALIAFGAALATVLIENSNLASATVLEFILPICFAAASQSYRDMFIRIAFVSRRESIAFSSAVVVALSLVGGLIVSVFFKDYLRASTALYVYGGAQILGAFQILLYLHLPWHELRSTRLKEALRDSWRGGRWHVLSSLLQNIRAQAHSFVAAPILGLSTLAEVNAARILLSPVIMVVPPIYHVLLPRLAEKRTQNPSLVVRKLGLPVGALLALAALYCSALIATMDTIIPIAFGPSYIALDTLIIAWSAVTLLLIIRNGLGMALEVLRAFRGTFFSNLTAALFSVVAVAVLATSFGGDGAVWALAAAELVLCVLFALTNWKTYRSPATRALH